MESFNDTLVASAFTERFGAGKLGPRSFSGAVRFDVDCSGSACLLSVNGEIDIFNSPELEAKIADLGREHPGAILVSFALCTFADCSCLRILLRQFKLLGERLLIVAPPATALRRILDLTCVVKVLPVYKALSDAYLAIVPDVPRIAQPYTRST